MDQKRRTEYLQRWTALETERSEWREQWRDLSQHLMPRTGRFLLTDRNRGEKRHNRIYDNTGTRAVRTLAAGMMAGMSSPARPWFRLATPDTQLNEQAPVKLWLNTVVKLMREIFAKSNTYRALHGVYEELGIYGTAADVVLPDFDNVLYHFPMTAGEYCISTDYRGQVTTLYREFEMTVGQIISQFVVKPDGSMDWSNVSLTVRNLYENGRGLDAWLPILHVIEPRSDREREAGKRDAKNMPFASVYLELGSNRGRDNLALRESGFKRFPALCPRWHVSGGDIYGNSPGMEALGDIRQLQHAQLRKGQAIDYQVKPPLQVPTGLKQMGVSTLPGGVSFVDASSGQGIRSAWEVNLNTSTLLEDINDTRNRINSTFYADLFLMLANIDHTGMTAREIAERHEEKLLMLGPVLERLHNELLTPLIDVTFDRIIEAGIVPPPPPELQGMDLNVEFVSTLAQAQRAVGTTAVDRLIGTVASIANAKGDLSVWDKLDTDQIVDEYSEMLGVDPTLIVADDQVAIIRGQRQKAQQAEAAMAMAQGAATTAKDISDIKTDGKNGLTDLTQLFSGYSIPTGQ